MYTDPSWTFSFFSTKLGLFWTRKRHHVLTCAFKSLAALPAPLSLQKTCRLLPIPYHLQHAQTWDCKNHPAEPATPEGAGWPSEVLAYKHHSSTVCADDACWNAAQKRSRKSPDKSNPDSTDRSYNLPARCLPKTTPKNSKHVRVAPNNHILRVREAHMLSGQ